LTGAARWNDSPSLVRKSDKNRSVRQAVTTITAGGAVNSSLNPRFGLVFPLGRNPATPPVVLDEPARGGADRCNGQVAHPSTESQYTRIDR
jgi:hypothetical protein